MTTRTVTSKDGIRLTTVGGKPEQPEQQPPKDTTMEKAQEAHRQGVYQAFEAVGEAQNQLVQAEAEVARLRVQLTATHANYERVKTMTPFEFGVGHTEAEMIAQGKVEAEQRRKQEERIARKQRVVVAQAKILARSLLEELGVAADEAAKVAGEIATDSTKPEEIVAEVQRWYSQREGGTQ